MTTAPCLPAEHTLEQYNSVIIALAGGRLGNIMDSWLQNAEAEHMVAQTIRAAAYNLEQSGEAFSIRSDDVFTSSGAGIVDNASAYSRLMEQGYFTEARRIIDGEEVTVIFPTRLLLLRVDDYLQTE